MTFELDDTHDPTQCSWLASANLPGCDFPVQNLPFGRFRQPGQDWRIGVAIGDQILDLHRARQYPIWTDEVMELLLPLAHGDLNTVMLRGAPARRVLRHALFAALAEGGPEHILCNCLVPQAEAELDVPCQIGDYTDFYIGIHHATAVGKLFRPDQPLLPNYKWVPIGYHGRASSIVPSGSQVKRPKGQTAHSEGPIFGPTRKLDFELELGFLVGQPNALGEPVPLADAHEHLFGVALFNDWSARDIQAWEYQPLGPFLSKNFASTISPWVVTMEALAPFRAPFVRHEGEPQPLPYLDDPNDRRQGALNIELEVLLQTEAMRRASLPPQRIAASNAAQAAYWTPAQLVAHHTVNGCNLQAGDLLGSGTLSGPEPGQAGSLLELTSGGRTPICLPSGERRSFLEDGDTVVLTAYCQRAGAYRIGFGTCTGTIVAA